MREEGGATPSAASGLVGGESELSPDQEGAVAFVRHPQRPESRECDETPARLRVGLWCPWSPLPGAASHRTNGRKGRCPIPVTRKRDTRTRARRIPCVGRRTLVTPGKYGGHRGTSASQTARLARRSEGQGSGRRNQRPVRAAVTRSGPRHLLSTGATVADMSRSNGTRTGIAAMTILVTRATRHPR